MKNQGTLNKQLEQKTCSFCCYFDVIRIITKPLWVIVYDRQG